MNKLFEFISILADIRTEELRFANKILIAKVIIGSARHSDPSKLRTYEISSCLVFIVPHPRNF